MRSGDCPLYKLIQRLRLLPENVTTSRMLDEPLKQFERPQQASQHCYVSPGVLSDLIKR